MSEITPVQRKIIFILPTISSLLALVSSITIMVMVLKSKKKLSSSYRRLIFGMSALDAIYSVGNVVSSLPIPKSTNVWGAFGDQQTCEAQGFILYLGMAGMPMYTLSLCIFYYHSLAKVVPRAIFVKRIEPFLHVIPFAWAVAGATFHLVKGNYNPGADFLVCWVGPAPPDCGIKGVPCTRGVNAQQTRHLMLGIPVVIICGVLVATMTLISCKVYRQEKIIQKYKFQIRHPEHANYDKNGQGRVRGHRFSFSLGETLATNVSCSKKNKAVMSQSFLYVLAYLLSWCFPFMNSFIERDYGSVSFPLRVLGRLFWPAQGFMNILVYTRPHVTTLRKMYPHYSWLKAFITVVKSGGDNDGNLDIARRQSRILIRLPSTLDIEIIDSFRSESEEDEDQHENSSTEVKKEEVRVDVSSEASFPNENDVDEEKN